MAERKQGKRSAQAAEETKRLIIIAAAELFCDLGYERVSIRNISDKAGVSHSLIRHHFGSKEKIWHAISDTLHDHMQDTMKKMLESIPTQLPLNARLYQFSCKMLSQIIRYPMPMQLIADGIRQEDKLFDYFLTGKHKVADTVFHLYDELNETRTNPIDFWEVKWQLTLYAHGAISLKPLLHQTYLEFEGDKDKCLLKHWQLFEQQMARLFEVKNIERLNPTRIDELIVELDCNWSTS
ncbi:TetR/AcrR family transcriptional regulator [Vibrio maerlii]|uniref:TetR/AcrR family transcriptional regulator n=1 Tax=Vibrio maerlii TaxID=2231648 RepID=UPI000E3E9644|nr:TetR/AcrR family transcriptional regulator [Vibrio maerlii]